MSEAKISFAHDVRADAVRLKSLHIPGKPLMLANCWDCLSARATTSAGVAAVATSSAGVAATNGYADHGKMPPDVAFGAIANIAETVRAPVTADIEHGYGLAARDIVDRLTTAGACGINIEDSNHEADGLFDVDEQSDRIANIRSEAAARGFELVINARIDVYLKKGTTEDALERGRRYLDAGADCIFPIFAPDLETMKLFTKLGLVNALWQPRSPTTVELAAAGVSRISSGPYFYQSILSALLKSASAFRKMQSEF